MTEFSRSRLVSLDLSNRLVPALATTSQMHSADHLNLDRTR